MKRALRVIVPLLLALAVIFCGVWYLTVYDRDFAKDMLLRQARAFESAGNIKAAAWLYDVAYYQSSADPAVAIELADRYRAVGNYTKAEYTLSRAIAENSTPELYIALCKTYVEQDKLLDAVTMLDTIADAQIKAKLDALRPKAPTVNLAPGYYNQYITLEFSTSAGTLYVAADNEYPSTETDRYTEPLTMKGGETTVYAVAVADNSLVSPCSKFGYTIGGVIEQVKFTDSAVESALRKLIQAGSTKPIFTDELWTVTEFTVPEDAKSYEDLAYLPYLKKLTVKASEDIELKVLSKLTQLEDLSLTGCRRNDEEMAAIGALTTLKHLTLSSCGISTVNPLADLKGLTRLDISNNTVRNLAALAKMPDLEVLNLSHNALTDLSALAGLNKLQTLDVSYNSLSSLTPICDTPSLTSLKASNNTINSTADLKTLTALEELDLSHNSLTEVNGIAACTRLTELNLSNNSLTDITALRTLVELSILNFSNNEVTQLPAFAKDCPLITIDGSHNQIRSVEPLARLPKLNNVLLDYNPKLYSLWPLDSCPRLVMVNVYGTQVTDVTFLTEKKTIIVNFNPTT